MARAMFVVNARDGHVLVTTSITLGLIISQEICCFRCHKRLYTACGTFSCTSLPAAWALIQSNGSGVLWLWGVLLE